MLPNSDIEFIGLKMDVNGNKTAYFIKAGTKIKVQTNGNMPRTHRIGLHDEPTEDQLLWMRKELVCYLFEIQKAGQQ